MPLPPEIPSHPDYSLPGDDGKVVYTSMLYPERITVDGLFNSSYNRSTIPSNYMANLT